MHLPTIDCESLFEQHTVRKVIPKARTEFSDRYIKLIPIIIAFPLFIINFITFNIHGYSSETILTHFPHFLCTPGGISIEVKYRTDCRNVGHSHLRPKYEQEL